MALHGADGDALVQRMQQLELVAAEAQPTLQAAHEELGEVKTLTEAEERAAQQGWAELPPELLVKVFEVLQEVVVWRRREPKEGGLAFSKAVAVVREVCTEWQAVHDAAVKRLVLSHLTTDEAMGMLVRRFPAVTSVEVGDGNYNQELTDVGVLAVSSMPALTALNLSHCRAITDVGVRTVSGMPLLVSLNLTCCEKITDVGVRAVSGMPLLASLNLTECMKITDEAARAVSSMPALTELNLSWCDITDEAARAVSSVHTLTSLHLSYYTNITDVGVRALSSLPALTQLNLCQCPKVTAAGVQALRSTTASPNLVIEFP